MTHISSPDRYGEMIYRRCGNSGLKLPVISTGLYQHFTDSDPYRNCKEIVCHSFDLGITHFDLANNYGNPAGSSEEIFGCIINSELKGYRDEIIVTTKAGYDMWPGPYGEWGSKKYLVASMDQSLKRLGLDYVDIFYSHMYDPETPLEETMAALDLLVRQGKALYAGISNYDVRATKKALSILKDLGTPCLIHQSSYSMLNRSIEDDLQNVLTDNGVGLIVFQPMQRGILTGNYLGGIPADQAESLKEFGITADKVEKAKKLNVIAQHRGQTLSQMAIAWTLRDGKVTSALCGAKEPEHIDMNVGAIRNMNFSEDELAAIDDILK